MHLTPATIDIRRPIAALAVLLALIIAACNSSGASPTPTALPSATPAPATATPAGPPATATPDRELLLRDGGIAIIETAYTRLLDGYIDPLDPAGLLAAAWSALQAESAREGYDAPAQPAFTGERIRDIAAFGAAYVAFVRGVGDPTKLRYAAIRGMTETLADCHTYFLNPVASDTLLDTRAGKGAVGIGIELAGQPPLVTEVVTGGPAARAGVLVGDRIAGIDGRDASAFGPSAAFDLINGTEGTSVRLQLRRPGGDDVDVTIARERVIAPNIETRIVAPGVGYLRIRNFVDGGVYKDLRDRLLALDRDGATSWIIDIRNNPGGRLDPESMSLFIKDGVVVRDRGRGAVVNEERANGDVLPVVRPTVLLLNNRTGSVAEAFAAALDEYDAAYLIGETSNGCVGYTDIQPLGDGSSLAVTTHVNLGPVSGAEINGVGVIPDQIVARTPNDIANARDPQLDAAVRYLTSG